jgi:8-oxo-dGTP diphosphatase
VKVDWSRWVPAVRSTLVFVRRGRSWLLIRKRRGLGAGKINAPGGKLDPGESPAECGVRELHEEVGVVVSGLDRRGELSFQFVDGLALHVEVFVADGCEGEPVTTDEAFPVWIDQDAMPYDEMWADDAIWLPHLLAGRTFALWAVFDGDRMLDWRFEVEGTG